MIRIESPNNLCRHWLVLELMKRLSFNSFLEIGVGNGVFLRKLAEKKYSGKGVDISDDAIRSASERLKHYDNVIVEKNDFFNLREKTNLILMLQVLEHIENDADALKKIKDLLAPRGHFILTVPACKRKWGYNDMVGGHYRRYERKELAKLLEKTGFKIKHFWSYGVPITNLLWRWEEICYRRYFFNHGLDKKTRAENTKQSGLVMIPWAMGFPSVFRIIINEIVLSPLFFLQTLFLNTDLGLNYIVLAETV